MTTADQRGKALRLRLRGLSLIWYTEGDRKATWYLHPLDSIQHIFATYRPRMTPIRGLQLLRQCRGPILLGEIHGIRENADVVYSLVKRLGIDTLAIEQLARYTRPLISSALDGALQLGTFDVRRFVGGMLSVEALKAITCLLGEDRDLEIAFIDSWARHRETGITQRIVKLPSNRRTLCWLGNQHTDVGHKHKEGSAAAAVLRRFPDAAVINLRYASGEFYNVNTGLAKLQTRPTNRSNPSLSLQKVAERNYELLVPQARATQYRPSLYRGEAA